MVCKAFRHGSAPSFALTVTLTVSLPAWSADGEPARESKPVLVPHPVPSAEALSQNVPRDRQIGPGRNSPSYVRAGLEVLGVLSIGVAQYWANAKTNSEDWDFPRWSDRLSSAGVRFDNNTLVTNNVLHPLAGAAYYGLSRASGLSVPASALYAFAGSAAWEGALEWREKVSINDMIATTVGGIAAGEFLIQLAGYLNSAPTETNFAQDVAKTTLGFPVWINDRIDGRVPDARPARDNLGFSSAYSHRFSADFQNTWIGDGAERTEAIRGVALDAHLVSLPGYLDPESFETTFAQGNFSSGSLNLQFDGEGLREARMKVNAVLGGYYAQRSSGSSLIGALAGLATGLEFSSEDTLDRPDRYALLHCAGPELGATWKWRDYQLDLGARASADFAAIRSLAWPALRASDPDAVYKSSLARSYQYNYGISTRLTAELRLRAARLYADVSWGSYRSIQGFDRFQEEITRDPAGSEVLDEHRVGLALEPPDTPLRFYSQVEGFSHESSLGGQAGRRLERRLAIGAGLVF
jgi:hypothetical protein